MTSVKITPLTAVEATQKDPRLDNFIEAYLEIGCEDVEAQWRGHERLVEDNDARFTMIACTNFSTAKETVWLLEAASMLCCGSLGDKEAIRLVRMALDSLEANR